MVCWWSAGGLLVAAYRNMEHYYLSDIKHLDGILLFWRLSCIHYLVVSKDADDEDCRHAAAAFIMSSQNAGRWQAIHIIAVS